MQSRIHPRCRYEATARKGKLYLTRLWLRSAEWWRRRYCRTGLLGGDPPETIGRFHLTAQPFRRDVERVRPGRCAEFAKYPSSRNGSSVDPGSSTIAAKSRTPSLPSLNRTRSRKPPSFSMRLTLVSIEACNPLRLLARMGETPIFAQLLLPRQRPLLDETGSCLRQRPRSTALHMWRTASRPDI
jgi:hypothetical protein